MRITCSTGHAGFYNFHNINLASIRPDPGALCPCLAAASIGALIDHAWPRVAARRRFLDHAFAAVFSSRTSQSGCKIDAIRLRHFATAHHALIEASERFEPCRPRTIARASTSYGTPWPRCDFTIATSALLSNTSAALTVALAFVIPDQDAHADWCIWQYL